MSDQSNMTLTTAEIFAKLRPDLAVSHAALKLLQAIETSHALGKKFPARVSIAAAALQRALEAAHVE